MPSNNCPFPAGSKVNAYLRDSGGDEQDLSVPQQEAVIVQYCIQNSLILVHLFVDAAKQGGSTAGREAFDRMMEHFLGGCDENGLILWSLARFARNDMDSQLYKIQLRKAGYVIHSMSDNLPEGIYGRLIEYVIDFNNALFREMLSKEVKRGLKHLVVEYNGMPGVPPVGFKREEMVIGKKRNGEPRTANRWVIDPDLRERVQMAWQMRAAGASYKTIHKVTKLYGTKNSYPTFFRNELYRGILHFGNTVVENYCEPLIDQDTWEAVQKRQQPKVVQLAENHPRRAVSQFLLTGLVKCARCGGAMNGDVVNTREVRRRWVYYLCTGRSKYKTCEATRIPQELLETAILDDVVEYVLQPDTLRHLREVYEAGREGETEGLEVRRALLDTELRKTRTQVSNLVRAIAVTGHNDALLKELGIAQAIEKETLAELDELVKLVRPARPPLKLEDLESFAEHLRQRLREEPLDNQRAILKGLIQKIEAERQGEEIKLKIHYFFFDGGNGKIDYTYDMLPLGGTFHTWRTWQRTLTVPTK